MSSLLDRLGLWRLWRNRFGRRAYRLLHGLGLVLAVMVQYETPPADVESPSSPTGVELDSWSADDPPIPDAVPGSLDPDDIVVGATVEGDLVGYCVLSPRPVLVSEIGGVVEPASVYLWDLYVEPAHRGRGLGTALLRRARADDLVAAAGGVEALVAVDNQPSRRAFRSAGFEPTERLLSVGVGSRTYRRRTALGSTPEGD